MDLNELKDGWKAEEKINFQGWNFSYLEGRWEEETLPWDYTKIVNQHLEYHHKLLDIGTGGGEILLSLKHPYKNTWVTEAWEPNIKLCREKLEPLGINVFQTGVDLKLPFEENQFDIIINRHESYDIKEVKRILRPNGVFITQQVGGNNNDILSERLIKDFDPKFPHINLKNAAAELEDNEFEIIYKDEYFPYLRFFDVGAIVYFAKRIEWEFPRFSVETCFSELCKIHEEIKSLGYIESLEHRFIIIGKNLK